MLIIAVVSGFSTEKTIPLTFFPAKQDNFSNLLSLIFIPSISYLLSKFDKDLILLIKRQCLEDRWFEIQM